MNREDLIAAMQITASPRPVPVPVPNWGTVYVKPPTVEEVDANTDDNGKPGEVDRKRRLARAAARVICDEQGQRLFDPTNKDDVDLLAIQPWAMLQLVLAGADGTKVPDSGNSDSAASSSSTLQ